MSLNSLRALPCLSEVMSPMYSAAPNGESACCSRNTVNAVLGGSPLALISNSSNPSVSVFSSTSMSTLALGMQPANWAEEGARVRDTDGVGADTAAVAMSAGAGAAALAPAVLPAVSGPAASRPKAHRVLMRMAVLFLSRVKPSDRHYGARVAWESRTAAGGSG